MKGQENTSSRTAKLLRPRHKKRDKCNLQIHSFSTLMHLLPLVCKRFYKLCSDGTSDMLWLQALERLATNDPGGWLWALWRQSHGSDEDTERWSNKKTSEMVTGSYSQFSSSKSEEGGGQSCARSFFEHLATNEAEPRIFSGHLVHNKNQAPPKVGASYRLVISDPKNLQAIRDLMHHRPMVDSEGKVIDDDDGLRRRPRFLYNYGVDFPAVAGDPVLLVEIKRCLVQSARIHLMIVPIMHVRLSQGMSNSTLLVARELGPIRPQYKRKDTIKTEEKKHVSAPMIRMFSTVAPQLGMEFLVEGIDEARYGHLLPEMVRGRQSVFSDGEVIPHGGKLPRPVIIYTSQPDRWMPLGEGIRGEDSFVVEIRRIKVKPSNASFSVTGMPMQLGKLLGPDDDDEASDVPRVSVKINVVLGPFGPKLV